MLAEKKLKVVDGTIIQVNYIPGKMLKDQKRFAKALNKSGAWMPETNMKQILEAYNEAFDQVVFYS